MGEWDIRTFFDRVAVAEYDLWVVEDYIIRPKGITQGYEHQWNKGTALRLIGAIELRVHQLGAELKKQQPSIKPIAAKKSGVPYTPKKKGTHMFDAVLHGNHYLDKEHPNAPAETKGRSSDSDEPRVRTPARVARIDSLGGLRKARDKASMEVPRKKL